MWPSAVYKAISGNMLVFPKDWTIFFKWQTENPPKNQILAKTLIGSFLAASMVEVWGGGGGGGGGELNSS